MVNKQNLKPWKPGQSGNPYGKPVGTKNLSTVIKELLCDESFIANIRQGYVIKEYKGAPIKALVQAQILLAVNGDQKAFELLAKYGYGTKIEITPTSSSYPVPILNGITKKS